MDEHFYHLFANGDDAKNFITTESEFKAAFNRFGICAYLSGAEFVGGSVEDSHPHGLLYGAWEQCCKFKTLYEDMSVRSIVQKRGSLDGVSFHIELYDVKDEQYLMNVATYTIVQPTKDGKAVMPYDYLYGTGALYFRNKYAILPWLVDENGKQCEPVRFGDLSLREKRELCCSRTRFIPDDWLVCNGFILPTNYVNVKRFEGIYRTHNCFRVFSAGSKSRDDAIRARMAEVRGVIIEDLEARKLCADACRQIFGKPSTRLLNPEQRLYVGQQLRNGYHLSPRQIAMLINVPESEVRKYIK